jgi:hypothetical protein
MPIKSPVTPTGHGRLTAGGDGLEPCALPYLPGWGRRRSRGRLRGTAQRPGGDAGRAENPRGRLGAHRVANPTPFRTKN